MRISEILEKGNVTLSMEVFPPKSNDTYEAVAQAVDTIADLKPAFMSCTYGAAGGTRENTVKIAAKIQSHGVPAMAHMTCVGATPASIMAQVEAVKAAGIENILALRGDLPEGADTSDLHANLKHASQLTHLIKSVYPEACIGGACYPEKHPEAASKTEDIRYLKEKVDAGCAFLTTQMFFDNSIFYNYLFRLREAGIRVPVVAGIMPITSRRMLKNAVSLSGCSVPARFASIVDKYGSNSKAMTQAGIIYAAEQIVDLLANDIKHIHLYTMNRPEIAEGIQKMLSCVIGDASL